MKVLQSDINCPSHFTACPAETTKHEDNKRDYVDHWGYSWWQPHFFFVPLFLSYFVAYLRDQHKFFCTSAFRPGKVAFWLQSTSENMSALLKLVLEVIGVRLLVQTVFQPCFGTHKEESRSEEFMTKTSTKTKE